MNRPVLFSLICVLLLSTLNVDAQRWKLRRYEASVGIGPINHYGDLGGSRTAVDMLGFNDIQLKFTRPSVSLGFRYVLNPKMAVKLNLNGAYLSANDKNTPNEEDRYGGYSFRSFIFESSVQYEYYLLNEGRISMALFNRRGMVNDYQQFSIYLFGGAGSVLSAPKVFDVNKNVLTSDEWGFDASTLSKFGLAFPFGIGIKYVWNTNISFGFEYGRRYTLIDGIDGYTSMYSESNDMYDFISFSMVYKLITSRRGLPIIGNKARYRL